MKMQDENDLIGSNPTANPYFGDIVAVKPDGAGGQRPRSATIVVTRLDGGVIGA